jgi:predicted nucleotide-binding protein (sugar kinase/HSP70/actin superfamily)
MSQTGGACRASNYIALIKKALADAGLQAVPLLSLNPLGWEKHPGFKLNPGFLHRSVMGLILADLLSRLSYRQLPYAQDQQAVIKLTQQHLQLCRQVVTSGKISTYQHQVARMVRDFQALALVPDRRVPRVGIVGEILVKFHPDANHHLVEKLQAAGVEVVVPDLTDFFLYTAYNSQFSFDHLGGATSIKYIHQLGRSLIELYRSPVRRALAAAAGHFGQLIHIEDLAQAACPIISPGMCSGEGWFLTAEMIELLTNQVPNVLCLQPFACLPNHIVGRGMLGALREQYPQANLSALDYDPGTSEVANQNRLELFLTHAWRNLATSK